MTRQEIIKRTYIELRPCCGTCKKRYHCERIKKPRKKGERLELCSNWKEDEEYCRKKARKLIRKLWREQGGTDED